ncbi:MAG: hypothetical protein NC420_09890 [Eubacterium sp.]|nr:hypothetical protein [Eubacterium sp.]
METGGMPGECDGQSCNAEVSAGRRGKVPVVSQGADLNQPRDKCPCISRYVCFRCTVGREAFPEHVFQLVFRYAGFDCVPKKDAAFVQFKTGTPQGNLLTDGYQIVCAVKAA